MGRAQNRPRGEDGRVAESLSRTGLSTISVAVADPNLVEAVHLEDESIIDTT